MEPNREGAEDMGFNMGGGGVMVIAMSDMKAVIVLGLLSLVSN